MFVRVRIAVTGIIVDPDGLRLAGRRLGGAEAGKWEYVPAGGVEPWESPEAALRREMLEEVGVSAYAKDVRIGPMIGILSTPTSVDVCFRISVQQCLAPTPSAEHSELRWVKTLPDPVVPGMRELEAAL